MSLITFRAPGRGRRQANPSARMAAKNQRLVAEVTDLRQKLEGADRYIDGLHQHIADQDARHHTEITQVGHVLGEQVLQLLDERDAHAATRQELATAIRANTANENAETVQTDVTALRAAQADQYVEPGSAGPQYAAYARMVSPVIRVMPLHEAPFATTDPARVPDLAGAR